MANADSGQKLAEDCGLVWEELSEYEQRSWTAMASEHGDRREDVGPEVPFENNS